MECAAQTLPSKELDEDRMSKTPPNRRGITFEVGAQLEARDNLKNWYSANIEKIDYEDEKVLIHYRQWSHRYDEWFEWTSPYLRPVERIQLRRQGLQEDCPVPVSHGFHVNDKVLASWSDCRFYPAKVLSVNKDASYTVKFYDGVVQTVKGIHVKPYVRERGGGGKSRSTDRNGVRKPQNGRDRRPQENGGPKNKRARRSTSDQEEDSNTEDEDEEDDEDEWEGDERCKRKDCVEDGTKERAPTVKQAEGVAQQEGQNNLRDSGKEAGHLNVVKVEGEGGPIEAYHVNGEIKKEEVELTADHKDKEQKTDASSLSENKPSTESPPDPMAKTVPGTMSSIASTSDKKEQNSASPPDNSVSSGEVPPASTVIPKPVRKQGFHNPNRFSREPLYRVIKNQPPPVLSINLDHNPFKCSSPGCPKSFRKAKLLHYHMKYYHGEDQPLEDLSPTRSVQTRASEKQTSPTTFESPKRRRTISASMHSTVHNPSGVELKTVGRRTSAPPAVSSPGQQQRALLREKSKENQLDRNGCKPLEKEGEKSGLDLVLVKERDRLKDKKPKDFLRIKLKKRKKKKKAKSDEDSVSDWSTDSCGWSEEEGAEELDVTTPPMSLDSVAVETNDQEIVRCICEVEEENDFMIQCEECLCWQHGTCMGLLEENVPEKYTCFICRDPPGQRQSLRYWYDRDWLSSGHMYGLSFLEENYSHQNAKKISATHQLLGDVHHVVEVINGLQLKMSVLQSHTHPDLRLWCQPWKRTERPWKKEDSYSGTDTAPSPTATDEDRPHGEVLSAALEKLSRAASSSSSSSSSSPYLSFQDSYISSEHCYQKPRMYYPAAEQRLVVETRRGSELEDSLRSTEDLLEREQRYGGMLDTDRPKALSAVTKVSNAGCWSQVEVKQEEGVPCGGVGGAPDSSGQRQQWQINLLDHIDAVQDDVTHRMDFIERELDVLESWLDYTGELEPPEPLARLPQLKHRVKQLLSEMGKVQQIALCCST